MAARKPGKSALAFILVTVLLDTMGFGVIIPVTPELIMELTGEGLSRAAVYGGWLGFVYAGLQFLFAPILGNLSDRFGRRPVLLYAVASLGLDYIFMGLAPTISWLFIGRAISGIAGASFTPAHAYIADVSPPEKRAQSFGLMGAAFGAGFVLGPPGDAEHLVVLHHVQIRLDRSACRWVAGLRGHHHGRRAEHVATDRDPASGRATHCTDRLGGRECWICGLRLRLARMDDVRLAFHVATGSLGDAVDTGVDDSPCLG